MDFEWDDAKAEANERMSTDRGGAVRIISAREATRAERKDYEDGNFP